MSLSATHRVHSLLTACPQSSSVDSLSQSIPFTSGPESFPIVGSLTSDGLLAINQTHKELRAGSECQLIPKLDRPTCEFIHCPCTVCDQFRDGATSWKNAPCLQQPGCKCPHCQSAFNVQGHWDPTKMARLCVIRELRGEKPCSRTILKHAGVYLTWYNRSKLGSGVMQFPKFLFFSEGADFFSPRMRRPVNMFLYGCQCTPLEKKSRAQRYIALKHSAAAHPLLHYLHQATLQSPQIDPLYSI